jgi:O-antigen ligase
LSFIFFFVVNYLHKELFTRSQVILIYVVTIISLVLTGSRNSIIGVFMFLFFQKFYKINPFLGILMVLIVGYLAEVVGSNASTIISSLGLGDFFRVKTLDDGSGRYVAWGFAWKEIQQNLYIGKGFGYDEFYMRSNWDLLSRMGHQGGVHNTFLTFWMDMGLIGLIIYLRSFFITFLRAAKRNPLAFPIMFVITFTAFFESWLVGSLNPHTIIFLMILALLSDDAFYPEKIAVSDESQELETQSLLLEENGINT